MEAKMNVVEDNKFASIGGFAESNTRCKAQVRLQMRFLSMTSTSEQKRHYNYHRKFKGDT